MFVCSMSLFTSCNDDDDNNGEGPQLGRDIAGTYNGTLAMVLLKRRLQDSRSLLLKWERMR